MKNKALLLLFPCFVIAIFICAIWVSFVMRGSHLSDMQEMVVFWVFVPYVFTCISAFSNYNKLHETGENLKGMIRKTLFAELLTVICAIVLLCDAASAFNLWKTYDFKMTRFILSVILLMVILWVLVFAFFKS